MPKRYLGDDGFLQKFKTSHEILGLLKEIDGARSLSDASSPLAGLASSLNANGYALAVGIVVGDRYLTRIPLAHGRLAELAGKETTSASAWRDQVMNGELLRLDLPDAGALDAFSLRPQAVAAAVFGTTARIENSNRDFALLVSADPLRVPSVSQRKDRTRILSFALRAIMAKNLGYERLTKENAFSASEAEVLLAYSNGLSPSEIAHARKTSVRTVRNQLYSARRRVAARSNAHAVAFAIANGLIPAPSEQGSTTRGAQPWVESSNSLTKD